MDNNGYKKLTRSTSDRKIAGVCGGLAQYFNVDPTVVRIIFLVALICGTVGFWIYLIVWICAPEDNLLNQ
jgi:phage shock protein PspC (stress-responsive transcriptional regulator)